MRGVHNDLVSFVCHGLGGGALDRAARRVSQLLVTNLDPEGAVLDVVVSPHHTDHKLALLSRSEVGNPCRQPHGQRSALSVCQWLCLSVSLSVSWCVFVSLTVSYVVCLMV